MLLLHRTASTIPVCAFLGAMILSKINRLRILQSQLISLDDVVGAWSGHRIYVLPECLVLSLILLVFSPRSGLGRFHIAAPRLLGRVGLLHLA